MGSHEMTEKIAGPRPRSTAGIPSTRRLPVGAEPLGGGGVNFRVWAPRCRSVEVVTSDAPAAQNRVREQAAAFHLTAEPGGYFSGTVKEARAGSLYRFRLDGKGLFPDPGSRFQPEGPHGPSQVVDPAAFSWTDHSWPGVELEGQVIYEIHVGTFTREGTWQAAAKYLEKLAAINITIIEVMPVADFSGAFGWGYDGVNWFAPSRLYGTPDDFRAFVDRAHTLGLGVILDVVYNHFGADGNYTSEFSPYYVSKTHKTDWGDGLNYDGEHSAAVREFVLANVTHWISEYHLDGIRLDATQDISDHSTVHILSALSQAVRRAAPGRRTIVIAENEPQDTRLIRPPEQGGYAIDGLWNDDYHHSMLVALTGRSDAYYTDHRGTAQELLSAMKYGFLYQGQRYKWQKKRRGSPAFGMKPSAFIAYIQNHDQIANSARGHRAHLLSSPALYRSITTVLLLGPGTPMLFQGQEFGASTPFLYFADVPRELSEVVNEGRKKFLMQWRTLRTPEMTAELSESCARETFEKCKLDRGARNQQLEALHRDLLSLRRTDPAIRNQQKGQFDGAVLSTNAFIFRIFNADHGDRLLVVNLGPDLHLDPAPEPLLAPPENRVWTIRFSSEHPRYGGDGTPPLDTDENWRIPGQSAVLLLPLLPDEPVLPEKKPT
jgi:maltooligosyltrehalose trehalohydrolase